MMAMKFRRRSLQRNRKKLPIVRRIQLRKQNQDLQNMENREEHERLLRTNSLYHWKTNSSPQDIYRFANA